jgi:flavin-dependent dehydrogenase
MSAAPEILIIGGGLAGPATALALARSGRHVRLIEREAAPHDKVCGEFLAPGAVAALAALGLDPVALGAVPVDRLTLVSRFGSVATALPFRGQSLSRRVLDEVLLSRCVDAGVEVQRGRRAVGLTRDLSGWTVRLDDGERVAAPIVCLATGKHDLRDARRPAGIQRDLVGFKLHLDLDQASIRALERRVELVLFRGGYAGLQQSGGDRATLCLVIRRSRLAALGGRFPAVLEAMAEEVPAFRARLAGSAYPGTPLAVAQIPYGAIVRHSDGLWRLGDQAAVIPSFSGEGMAMALGSAALASATILEGGDSDAYQRRFARSVTPRLLGATLLSQALVRPTTQRGLAALAGMFPGLLSYTAMITRVSNPKIVRYVPE